MSNQSYLEFSPPLEVPHVMLTKCKLKGLGIYIILTYFDMDGIRYTIAENFFWNKAEQKYELVSEGIPKPDGL